MWAAPAAWSDRCAPESGSPSFVRRGRGRQRKWFGFQILLRRNSGSNAPFVPAYSGGPARGVPPASRFYSAKRGITRGTRSTEADVTSRNPTLSTIVGKGAAYDSPDSVFSFLNLNLQFSNMRNAVPDPMSNGTSMVMISSGCAPSHRSQRVSRALA